MKKTIAFLMTLVLIASLFAACGQEKEPTAQTPAPSQPTTGFTETAPPETTEITPETTESVPETTEIAPETAPPETVDIVIQTTSIPLNLDEPVYELYCEQGDGYFYSVPQINCHTPDADAINQTIASEYGDLVQYFLQDIAEGFTPSCYDINWSYHFYEDILVLLLWKDYDGGNRYHEVFCLNSITGSRLSNQDILSVCYVPADGFLEMARDSARIYFRESFPVELRESIGAEIYDELLEKTVSDESISMDMMMFPGEDGSLMLISYIASFAGAEAYQHIYPLMPE